MPQRVRGGGASSLDKSVKLICVPRLPPSDLAGPAEMPASCEIVFHSPQASHRPAHLVVTLPQAEQENEGDLLMPLHGAAKRQGQSEKTAK